MLLLDPTLSGVPATVFVDASPSAIASPTPAMLAETRAVFRENVTPYRWYRSNGSQLIEVGSGTPGTMSNPVYEGGLLKSVVSNGVLWTYTYDANGEMVTMSAGGVTRTISYSSGGDIDAVA